METLGVIFGECTKCGRQDWVLAVLTIMGPQMAYCVACARDLKPEPKPAEPAKAETWRDRPPLL